MHKENAHRRYVQAVRPLLPPEAFTRRPTLILYFACHFSVALACMAIACRMPTWASPVLGIIAGHSFACIAFFAHELSHGAVLSRGHLRRALEGFAWGVNFIPATLWEEVHNRVHHCHTNTPADPDRRWTVEEASAGTSAYARTLYPSEGTIRWNPLVFVQFLGYIVRNIVAAMSGGHWGLLPAAPSYSRRQRAMIIAELVCVIAIQAVFLNVLGWDFVKWLGVVLLGQAVASAVVMMYVFTNHFLNPLQDQNDPLAASTSVEVPRFIDWMHLRFSYHTEHHLFPSMDSRYTPLLSLKLRELFPDRYNRIPMGEAWSRLWRSPTFAWPLERADVDRADGQ